LVTGIGADGAIEEGELRHLSDWLDAHAHLRGCWPYDELDSLVMAVLQDGRIDDEEHQALLSFFSDFVALGEHRVIDTPLVQDSMLVFGVCAACPDVAFPGRLFCFTGRSTSAPRGALAQLVVDLGGSVSKSVTRGLDYLVVGAEGNPCWAFACYGRKVETAIRLRKAGEKLLIVHENDFWDAVEDAK
jgi:NAD-dependent DNA ligase